MSPWANPTAGSPSPCPRRFPQLRDWGERQTGKEGESSRFGIVHVDYETQKRTVKDSGRLYTSIVKNGGVTDEAYDAFVKDSRYK